MRMRALLVAGLMAIGVFAPTAASAAQVCYDVDVVLNGTALVAEEACLP